MKKQFVVLLFSIILLACGGDSFVEENVAVDKVINSELTPERAEKAQEVFHTIPSPMETATLFHSSGSVYKFDAANASSNVDNYVTNGQQALNLGVYGADLSYANVFDQSEESMIYINCAKRMSDALDISSAFGVGTIERIEDNMNNRDSLMVIIDDAFWIIDTHLKENGQDHLSALVMTGGWIEGLYLGTRFLDKESPDEKLMQRIAAQKASLISLMDLLITYDDEEVIAIERKMKSLQLAFDKIDNKKNNSAIIFEIASVVEKIRLQITR